MTKRLKKLTVAIAIGVVLIAAGIISGVCIINSSVNKRPTYVATAEELVAAINDDIDKPIVLSNDIVVHGDLTANKLFDLEMNDHNLRVIGTFTLKTDAAGEMYVCDGKNQIKKRERVQADKIVIDAVNATVTWNANVQLKNGYTADDFVVSSADHTFIFNGLMIGESGDAVKTAMTVKQGRVVVSASDENVKTPAEIVVPADAKDAYVDNKTEAEVNIKASASVSVAGTVSVDIAEKAENVKITAPEAGSSVTVKSGTAASVEAAGSDVTVDKGATVAGKVTAGKVENNGTIGEIVSDNVTDNSVAIRKADAKTELSAYALAKGKDNYSANGWESVKACVTAGNTAIDAATDIDGANAALAAAKAEIDKVKTAEQEAADALANKKTETLAALDEAKNNYKETDYREAEWKNVTDAYDNAKNGINAVTVITALPGNFVATFTATASAQKTNAQLTAEELAAKKAEVLQNLKAAYDGIDLTLYRETEKNAITAKYEEQKEAVNAVTDIANLPGTFVTDFNAFVATQKTNAQLTAEELAAKKAEVLQNLKAAYDGIDLTLYRETEKNAITAKYEEQKEAVNAVTDIANLPGTFVTDFNAFVATQKTNAQLTAEELAAKKAEVIATLDTEHAKYAETDYRAAQWKNITDAYDAAKAGIEAVTDINNLPGEFVKTFTDVAKAQKTDLAYFKDEQKTELDEYASEDDYTAANWTTVSEAVTAGKEAIGKAADKAGVNAAVSEAKAAIDAVAKAQAKLGEVRYDTFREAFEAVSGTEAQTITLLADVTDTTATEYVFDGVNVTLDLNGHVLDGLAYGGSGDTHYIIVKNEAVLTITDGSEAKTGKLTSWYAANSPLSVIYVENAKVVLNGGTITAHDANFGMVGIMAKANANVEINGGEVQGLYFKANRKRGYAINVAAATATLTVNGGVLSTNDPSCYAIYNTASGSTVTIKGGTIATISIAKNTIVSITGGTFKSEVKPDYLTKGYACLENEDGTYRVESGYVVAIGIVKYDTLSAAITAAKAGDVITVYNDVTENEGNIKYIIQKALTISGAYGATGVKPVIKGTFAVDINGVSDGSDVVTIENLEIVHNGVYVKDGWTQDTKGAVVLQDGGITLKNNYIHLVNPAPANVSNSPSGLQLSRRGASVSTGAITVSGNTFGAYPKYSDKTNTIATAIQVTRNYTLSGVLVYGGLEVDDEKIYTGNKYENTDGNAQYVLYGNFDFAADKRGYTYVVFGDVFAYNRDGGDLLAGGKMIIARSFTLTDKVYDVKAGTELVIGKGATLDCNGLTLKVNGTLSVNGEITNVVYNYGENGKKVVYLSKVTADTVFDPNAEYVFTTASTTLNPIAIAASATVKKMTININAASFSVKVNAPITVVSPVVINGRGAIMGTDTKTKFDVTSDNAFIVKSGSLELNKIQLTHKSTTADTVKDFIKIDENANVAVTLNDVAFINTSNNSLFINVVTGATLDLSFSNVTVNGTAVAAESEIVKR